MACSQPMISIRAKRQGEGEGPGAVHACATHETHMRALLHISDAARILHIIGISACCFAAPTKHHQRSSIHDFVKVRTLPTSSCWATWIKGGDDRRLLRRRRRRRPRSPRGWGARSRASATATASRHCACRRRQAAAS
jgi:hypothetical protein